jgi:hypothetical protein
MLFLKFTFDILLFCKSIFCKIDQDLINVYKTLYMQNVIWSLLQDCVQNMNNELKYIFACLVTKSMVTTNLLR